jgi:hypothetical protein
VKTKLSKIGKLEIKVKGGRREQSQYIFRANHYTAIKDAL